MGVFGTIFFKGSAIFMSNLPPEYDAITKLWPRQSHAQCHINFKNLIGFALVNW